MVRPYRVSNPLRGTVRTSESGEYTHRRRRQVTWWPQPPPLMLEKFVKMSHVRAKICLNFWQNFCKLWKFIWAAPEISPPPTPTSTPLRQNTFKSDVIVLSAADPHHLHKCSIHSLRGKMIFGFTLVNLRLIWFLCMKAVLIKIATQVILSLQIVLMFYEDIHRHQLSNLKYTVCFTHKVAC